MSRATSPSSGRIYGVAMVAQEWGVARSTFYSAQERKTAPPAQRRGPRPRYSDDELVEHIRRVLGGRNRTFSFGRYKATSDKRDYVNSALLDADAVSRVLCLP